MKTLLSGCSLSDYCGFGKKIQRDNLPALEMIGNHDDERCWYNIVKKTHALDLTNVSYGGFSNEEILSQIIKHLGLIDDIELVIVQLTSTQRKWFHRADNPFDFVLAHGVNGNNETEKKLLEYFRVHFNNELIEIERTLALLLLIQNYLKEKSIPLVVINGINFGKFLNRILTDSNKFCQSRIPKDIWQVKGAKYASELEILAKKIDLQNFVLLDQSLVELQFDTADDLSHPGEKSNLLYADIVSKKISQILQNH